MAVYKLYLRSFAPWYEFGDLVEERAVSVPAISIAPPSLYRPSVVITSVPVPFGGSFHGDGRGFSLDTAGPRVTARVNAVFEVNLETAAGNSKAWCDPSFGPSQGVGLHSSAVGKPDSEFTISRSGKALNVVIAYGASNPLVIGAPDIDARGEYSFLPDTDSLTIDATITGDQFPACESFVEDVCGTKLFLGGFAPDNKKQITRLFGGQNQPKKIWFESHLVVSVDSRGCFKSLQGGGSGSNRSGPTCDTLTLSPTEWNARIMLSIPMPSDAP
jgi:hypothetical protein